MDTNIEEVQTKKKDKGFTLVELLIVIVILGILATVTVFAVRGITDQGQESACEATAKTYEVAIEAYYAANGTANHPDGDDLETAGFIRDYDPTHVVVVPGVASTPPLPTDSSTVDAAAAPGKCVGVAGVDV
jgi:prepilin-type N-terminal cleavage/methylation domain-containing protein